MATGMSYTDDGLPFEALNIPCVMISGELRGQLLTTQPARTIDPTLLSPALFFRLAPHPRLLCFPHSQYLAPPLPP